jgi:hypothetical protein
MLRVFLAFALTLVVTVSACAQEKTKEEVIKLLTEVKPLYGAQVTVCAGQTAPGWAVINVDTDFTSCGGNWNNKWTLFELNGAPAGSQVTVCSFSSSQSGWVSIGTSTDFTRCGKGAGNNNLTTLQKL